jgi:hypothetical protein
VTHWTERAPAMVLHDEGLDEEQPPTPQDRRWLWRLESFLAVYGTNPGHHQMRYDLYQYLCETCDHRWREYAAEADIEAHRQCRWCNDVEWLGGQRGGCPTCGGEVTEDVGNSDTGGVEVSGRCESCGQDLPLTAMWTPREVRTRVAQALHRMGAGDAA